MAPRRQPGDRAAVNPIRVLVADVHSIRARMICEALEADGMRVVERRFGRYWGSRENGWEPDVVIVSGRSAGVPRRYQDLLRRRPQVKLLAMTAAADGANLYELRPLGRNVGYRGVANAVRSVIAHDVASET